ncbi:MAG: hypothetical protein FWG04_04635 [Desulfovibrionaceae bacterium]|nr:hypothetical protein [Desulfovibrionaceae bacterium]
MATSDMNASTVRTLADWGVFYKNNDDGKKAHNIIEVMDQSNSILDDITFMEASDTDGNRTLLRTKIPTVYWRQLYRGTPPSKSHVSLVKDPVGMLEGRSMIDLKLLEIHKDRMANYRLGEIKAFGESMRQELAKAIFYGDVKNNPLGINGLAMRYAYKDAPNVVDAGGTGAGCTSMYGVVWGERETFGIFPKGSTAGLKHEDLHNFDAYDENGNAFRATGDLVSWNVGLAVADWRPNVRVCNIPVDKLMLKKGDPGFVDLHRLTIIAKNKVPAEKRSRLIWYVPEIVMTALELQASDAGNVRLIYGDLFRSKNVPHLHGSAVRQCDAILETEAALGPVPAA